MLLQYSFNDWRISPGRGEDKFSNINTRDLCRIRQLQISGIDKIFRDTVIEALRIAVHVMFVQQVMPGGGKTVTSHAPVIFTFVVCLARGGKSDNNISRPDIGI